MQQEKDGGKDGRVEGKTGSKPRTEINYLCHCCLNERNVFDTGKSIARALGRGGPPKSPTSLGPNMQRFSGPTPDNESMTRVMDLRLVYFAPIKIIKYKRHIKNRYIGKSTALC
jgi:hypothetical protein